MSPLQTPQTAITFTKVNPIPHLLSIVVLSGEMNVGKSNFLQRYHKGIFTRISPTIGVEFLTKKIVLDSGVILKAQIWDTSGSERYRSITTGHYRSAVGALLMFDLTDRETFESLGYWLQCLRDHSDDNLVVALVGKIKKMNAIANKYDLVKERPEERKVTQEEIKEYAEKENLMYIGESSALSDTNIKEVVEALMESKGRFGSKI